VTTPYHSLVLKVYATERNVGPRKNASSSSDEDSDGESTRDGGSFEECFKRVKTDIQAKLVMPNHESVVKKYSNYTPKTMAVILQRLEKEKIIPPRTNQSLLGNKLPSGEGTKSSVIVQDTNAKEGTDAQKEIEDAKKVTGAQKKN